MRIEHTFSGYPSIYLSKCGLFFPFSYFQARTILPAFQTYVSEEYIKTKPRIRTIEEPFIQGFSLFPAYGNFRSFTLLFLCHSKFPCLLMGYLTDCLRYVPGSRYQPREIVDSHSPRCSWRVCHSYLRQILRFTVGVTLGMKKRAKKMLVSQGFIIYFLPL